MKYKEPNLEIFLIYEDVITTSGGPLEWDENQEGSDMDDLEGLN